MLIVTPNHFVWKRCRVEDILTSLKWCISSQMHKKSSSYHEEDWKFRDLGSHLDHRKWDQGHWASHFSIYLPKRQASKGHSLHIKGYTLIYGAYLSSSTYHIGMCRRRVVLMICASTRNDVESDLKLFFYYVLLLPCQGPWKYKRNGIVFWCLGFVSGTSKFASSLTLLLMYQFE